MTTKTPHIQQINMSNLRICFVDNEEGERHDIQESLKYLGNTGRWMVVDFSESIIQRAINNEFDIFVCDFKMPDKDGITVMEEIRRYNNKVILALFTAFAISQGSNEDKRCKMAYIERFKKFDGVGCVLGTLQNRIPKIQELLKAHQPPLEPRKGTLRGFIKSLALNTGTGKGLLADYFDTRANQQSPPAGEDISQPMDKLIDKNPSLQEIHVIIMNIAEDLIKDLEKTEDQESYIFHSEKGKITIKDLKDHIKNLTPIGIEQIKYWLLARKRLKNIKK